MSQITTLEKQNKNKPITDSKIKIKLHKIIHPVLLKTVGTKIKYKITKENDYEAIAGMPIIFAINHTNSHDAPIAYSAIKKHGYILAGKQPLERIDELFFKLNGSIFVDRKCKEDSTLSKEAAIEYLQKNQNIIIFPEGTWNTSENQLMLNMKWGIIEIAQRGKAQIIPVVLEYDNLNKKCAVKFGKTLVFDQGSDKKEGIETLRDSMATLKWELFEKKGITPREQIDENAFKKEIEESYREYPKLDVEYEKTIVFKKDIDPEDVYAPVKKIGMNRKNAFLYGKNVHGRW